MAKSSGGKKRGTGGGARALRTRVKTARGRTNSSTRWLDRQLNDPYVAKAKQDGLRSRAAFKLSEIDDRYKFLQPGIRVVDLGSAPGGWSQVAAERVGVVAEGEGQARVIAIDVNPVEPIGGVLFLELDFLTEEAPEVLLEVLGGKKVDVVLSDMAAPASGHKRTDHIKIMALCEEAADFAVEILAPDGVFLAKVLRGGTEGDLLVQLKRNFSKVRHVKPKASRADSAEAYVLATGFHAAE